MAQCFSVTLMLVVCLCYDFAQQLIAGIVKSIPNSYRSCWHTHDAVCYLM